MLRQKLVKKYIRLFVLANIWFVNVILFQNCTSSGEMSALVRKDVSSTSAPELPAPVASGPIAQPVSLDLKALMSTYLTAYDAAIENESLSGLANIYVNTRYYLAGIISAIEGTDDEQLLIKQLHYINNMINKAADLNGDGLKEWGPLDANNRQPQSLTFATVVPMARTVAYIRNSAIYKTKYAQDASNIYNFIDQNVMHYWFDKNTGVYKAPTPSTWAWPAGYVPWVTIEQGGWEAKADTTFTDAKAILMASTAVAMYQAGHDPFYLDLATRTASWFKARFENAGQGYVWDAHFTLSYWQSLDPRQGAAQYDTSHANPMPLFVAMAYDAGIVFNREDLTKFARTLTETIWLQASPMMFANYITGDNSGYLSTPEVSGPGKVGNIYFGWAMLASYDTRVNEVMRMTLFAVKNGQEIGQNNSPYGKIALTGALLRTAKY